MITAEDIYKATDGGKRIIEMYYPNSTKYFGTNKAFAIRDERTPSTHLRQYDGIWYLTDFGDSGKGKNALSIVMEEDNCNFPEAIAKMAAVFGLKDELSNNINKPKIHKKPATIEMKHGERFYEWKDRFSDAEMRIMGPKVTQEDLNAMHWHSCKYVAYVKKKDDKGHDIPGEVIYTESTENYPIFMRECLVSRATATEPEKKFYKIYQPYNTDKAFRFSYFPVGEKPDDYINGFEELKTAFAKFQTEQEEDYDGKDDGPVKETKLPMAFICSGERDAMCVKSLGYQPLWFNSETHLMTEFEYRQIMRYVEVLYNIPDIDDTGIRQGRELAKRYLDVCTVWLPSSLREYTDNRGRGRKDFRDWMDLHRDVQEFKNLLNIALPAKFWTARWNKKQEKMSYDIDSTCLLYFLNLQNFHILCDRDTQDTQYIHIDGNVVSRILAKDMRAFIRNWAEESGLPREVRNLFLNSPKLNTSSLEDLKEIELDFTNCSRDRQIFFFENAAYEITKDGIKEHSRKKTTLMNFVWEEKVIKHRIKLLEDFFTVSWEGEAGSFVYDIKINNFSSKVLCYLINASRIYWREELEYGWESDKEGQRAYKEHYKFCIDGPRLTEDQIYEQKINLINKLFVLGYMGFRYKDMARAYAPLCMDNKIGDNNQSNGGSGKSLMFRFLSHYLNMAYVDGRKVEGLKGQFVFEQVNKSTDFVFMDDCHRNFELGDLYNQITGDFNVNVKNVKSYTIPFNKSPKFCLTTNFVPRDFDPSSNRRLIYCLFSDYYHEKSDDNDYLESRDIYADFNKTLFDEFYSEAEWNADSNLLMQCVRFYMAVSQDVQKILPPLGNILMRKFKLDMGDNFEEWCESKFFNSPDNPNLDNKLKRIPYFEAYCSWSNTKITAKSFWKRLQMFCASRSSYIVAFNPPDMCTPSSPGKILGKDENGFLIEWFYIRTVRGVKKMKGDGQQKLNM